jgi:hypothetical protein
VADKPKSDFPRIEEIRLSIEESVGRTLQYALKVLEAHDPVEDPEDHAEWLEAITFVRDEIDKLSVDMTKSAKEDEGLTTDPAVWEAMLNQKPAEG